MLSDNWFRLYPVTGRFAVKKGSSLFGKGCYSLLNVPQRPQRGSLRLGQSFHSADIEPLVGPASHSATARQETSSRSASPACVRPVVVRRLCIIAPFNACLGLYGDTAKRTRTTSAILCLSNSTCSSGLTNFLLI